MSTLLVAKRLLEAGYLEIVPVGDIEDCDHSLFAVDQMPWGKEAICEQRWSLMAQTQDQVAKQIPPAIFRSSYCSVLTPWVPQRVDSLDAH